MRGSVLVTAALIGVLAGCTGTSATPADDDASVAPTDFTADNKVLDPYGIAKPSPGVVDFEARRAELLGPDFVFQFDWQTVVQEITGDLALVWQLPSELKASPGNEFIVLHVPAKRDAPPVTSDPPTPYKAELDIGGAVRTLQGGTTPDSIVVVSVPIGAPANLRVTASGRTQSLDLRTGQRGPDAVQLFYTRPSWSGTTELESLLAVNRQPCCAAIGFGKFDVSLVPYAPGQGWAAPGRAWLRATASLQLLDLHPGDDATVSLDAAKSFTITVAGKPVPALPRTLGAAANRPANIELLFPVPETLQSTTLTFKAVGRCGGCQFTSGHSSKGVGSAPISLQKTVSD